MSQSTKKASLPYSIFELAIAASFVLFLGIMFFYYLAKGVNAGFGDMGAGRSFLFLLIVLTVWLLSRAKDSSQYFYGGTLVFFGLGAVWHELLHAKAQVTPDGVNIEWHQISIVAVAALVAAEGLAVIRSKRRGRQHRPE